MSRHGPPREPGPPPGPGDHGPPTDPWDSGGHRLERSDRGGYPPGGYESPAGHGPPGYDRPGYDRPGYDPAGYPEPGGYDDPGYRGGGYQEPRYDDVPYDERRYHDAPDGDAPDDPAVTVAPEPGAAGRTRRPVALYAVVTVLVVLAAVGVGYALFLLTSQDDESDLVAEDQQDAAELGATADPDSPDFDNTGMNAAMARVDDCLVNDGSGLEPQMRIVSCDAEEEAGQLFQVLEIVNEEVAGTGDAATEQAQEICADTEGYTHHYYEVAESSSFVLCMAEYDAGGSEDNGGDAEDSEQ